jgi:hypothetical protein
LSVRTGQTAFFFFKNYRKEMLMAIINDVNEVLHRIRVKLYPNYLPGVQGVYFVSAADASQREKVSGHLAENTAAKVIGMIPALTMGAYRLETERFQG